MRIILLVLMAVSFSMSFGQSEGTPSLDEEQKQVPLVFDQHEFGNRFSVLSVSDNNYDYYVVNLSALNDRFERVYFMNLAYTESKLIAIGPDISGDQVWFKVYYTYKEHDIHCIFTELKEKTREVSATMTENEKSSWLLANDKFNKDK